MYIATPIPATSTGKCVSQRPSSTIGLGRFSRALWITKLSARMVWSGSIVEAAPIGAPHSSQNVANLLFGVRQETQVIVSSLLVISFLLATVCPTAVVVYTAEMKLRSAATFSRCSSINHSFNSGRYSNCNSSHMRAYAPNCFK